jgi:manganese/zinc/iron transport system substrate-binding protein
MNSVIKMKLSKLAKLIPLLLMVMVFSRVSAQDGTLRIVATTTQAADITRILTTDVDGIDITPLMGAGVDPHLYQPTEADIIAMNEANLVVYSGLNLEGQFGTVFNALGEQGVAIHALGQPVKDEGYTIGGFNLSEELQDVDDPHFWFDPRNWELSMVSLAETLSDLDPDNTELYYRNADDYAEQLQIIFNWAEEGMLSVPEGQRYLVTSHDAFQYFGAAFGWQMTSIQGISTEDEAGVADVQNVVDFVISNEIPVMFVESSISPNTVNAVVEAVSAQGGSIRIGIRPLYSDAMGAPDTFGGTYIGMLGENVYTILQSYQCAGVDVTIPDWPEDLEPQPDSDILEPDCAA